MPADYTPEQLAEWLTDLGKSRRASANRAHSVGRAAQLHETAEKFEAAAALLRTMGTPTFSDESYAIPLGERLRVAATDFSHPRLGIKSTGKNTMPIMADEARTLLELLTALSFHATPPGGPDGK